MKTTKVLSEIEAWLANPKNPQKGITLLLRVGGGSGKLFTKLYRRLCPEAPRGSKDAKFNPDGELYKRSLDRLARELKKYVNPDVRMRPKMKVQ